jgi:hypothetical protein
LRWTIIIFTSKKDACFLLLLFSNLGDERNIRARKGTTCTIRTHV